MIKGNESVVADIVFEISAKKDKIKDFIIFLVTDKLLIIL